MNYLVSLVALSGLVLIFAALPVLVVIWNDGPREEALVDELTERGVESVTVEGTPASPIE